MRLFLFISLLGFTAISASAQTRTVMAAGESFTFRVGWGIFYGAGEIKISADLPTAQPGQLRVLTTTRTRGFARSLYSFEASAESFFDLATGKLALISEKSATEKKKTQTLLAFDYKAKEFRYADTLRPERSQTLPLPAGEPLDLINCLLQTRAWNLPLGGHRDVLAVFDDELYELTVYADSYEEISTPLGDFKALVLIPKMEKGPPKGMFKRGSTVRVWISQDERHLPVRFKVDFKFGAGTATLTEYVPAVAKVAEAKAPTAPAPQANSEHGANPRP